MSNPRTYHDTMNNNFINNNIDSSKKQKKSHETPILSISGLITGFLSIILSLIAIYNPGHYIFILPIYLLAGSSVICSTLGTIRYNCRIISTTAFIISIGSVVLTKLSTYFIFSSFLKTIY